MMTLQVVPIQQYQQRFRAAAVCITALWRVLCGNTLGAFLRAAICKLYIFWCAAG